MADLIINPPPPNPSATRVVLTCSDCIFFQSLRLPNAAKPCNGMGCPPNRAPCSRYTPDVFSEAVGKAIGSKALRAALNAIPDAAAGSLAMAMAQVTRLRSVGLTLGQLVYFNAVGDGQSRDYLSNYYRAHVMLLDKTGYVMLKGEGVTVTITRDSLLTFSAWKEKRAALLQRGAIVDPNSPFTWERKDLKELTNPKYRPDWLDKEIARYRRSYLEAKSTRQTHDYDSPPVKRGRGRPKGSGKVKTYDVSAPA